jgi:hypothetical protein
MRCGVSLAEWGGETYYTTGPHLTLTKYPIIKRTRCGAWIALGFIFQWHEVSDSTDKRFVNLQARKKFACETEEEALLSFMARKKRQIRILDSQLQQAKQALAAAEQQSSVTTQAQDQLLSNEGVVGERSRIPGA